MQSQIPSGFEPISTYSSNSSQTPATPEQFGIQAWRHKATAVRIILFPAKGPLVSTTIFVGTQPLSNAGHPHTLEHLIFLGSKKYPRRGYLENLACRCIASGTNAWTSDEYTAYTTMTAGEEGSMYLIPCFLDHVMRPVINDAGFTSEVYYKREDESEAGVVFCEMQAREQTEDDLSDGAIRLSLLKDTPLAYNSGGLCEDIRKLTTDDIIRFHSSQYCGANITVVVGGNNIHSTSLLSSLKPLLDEIASIPNFSAGAPQWTHDLSPPKLTPVTRKEVKFPCPDQEIGTVIIGWRGPGVSDLITNLALDVLLRYLCGDSWSPLRQLLVEKEDQDASDIYYYYSVYSNMSVFSLSFTGVQYLSAEESDADSGDEYDEDEDEDEDLTGDSDSSEDDDGTSDGEADDNESASRREDQEMNTPLKSGHIEKRVFDFIKDVVGKRELPNGISAIHTAIDMERKEWQFDLESNAHEAVPSHLIGEILFGDQKSLRLGQNASTFLTRCELLKAKNEDFWISLLQQFFLTAPHVEITMIPDVDLAGDNNSEENSENDDKTSKRGNQEADVSTKLGDFKAEDFPPIPSIMNVSRFQYKTELDHGKEYITQNVTLETSFVHCMIFFDVSDLNIRDRIFLPFICELMPTCDIRLDDGSRIPYTENSCAIAEATVDTENSGTFLGFKDDLARQCVGCHFVASPSSIEKSIDLVLRTLFRAEITSERVAAVAQTFFSDAKTNMRDADVMLAAASELIPYQNMLRKVNPHIPTHLFSNFLGTFPLLSLLKKTFVGSQGSNDAQRKLLMSRLTSSMNAIRKLPARKIMVQVTAKDPGSVQKSFTELWHKYRDSFRPTPPKSNIESVVKPSLPISRRIGWSLSDLLDNSDVGKIIGIAGVESSYMNVVVHSEVYPGHESWASLRVLIELLCKMDGPLTNAIRGSGLAYGVGMVNYHWKGHFVASISESSSPAKAWDAFCTSLKEFRQRLEQDNDTPSLKFDLDTAKAATLYALNLSRSTPESISSGTVGRTALGAPASPDADQALEEAVEKVSLSDLMLTFDAHVAKIFQPSSRLAVVTCPQNATKSLINEFQYCRVPLKLQESTTESFFPSIVTDIATSPL